jgi:hypothetical protein
MATPLMLSGDGTGSEVTFPDLPHLRDETMTDETVPAPFLDGLVPRIDAESDDEVLARAARARYRADGIGSMEPDDGMRSALGLDEHLLAVRQTASVKRLSDGGKSPLSGRLAVTSQRLLVLDAQPLTLALLDDLDEVTLVSDRLLVMLTSGDGFTITAPNPMLLRVELAAARAGRLGL